MSVDRMRAFAIQVGIYDAWLRTFECEIDGTKFVVPRSVYVLKRAEAACGPIMPLVRALDGLNLISVETGAFLLDAVLEGQPGKPRFEALEEHLYQRGMFDWGRLKIFLAGLVLSEVELSHFGGFLAFSEGKIDQAFRGFDNDEAYRHLKEARS